MCENIVDVAWACSVTICYIGGDLIFIIFAQSVYYVVTE